MTDDIPQKVFIEEPTAVPAEKETSSLRKDAPVHVPPSAAVAAGEETSPDEEVLVLQQPPSQPEEEATSLDKEVLVTEQPIPVPNISEQSSSQEEYCPSENEGQGSPRIQPSEVPEEFLADLLEAEECEPDAEHVLPKIEASEKADARAHSSKKKSEEYSVRQKRNKKQRPRKS